MDLSNLQPAEGSRQNDNFRRGRGHGSGNGKTAGKGHKGQKARSGAPRPGFEGGQMPLYRRLPKRGFKNRNSKEIVGINVDALNRYEDGAVVTVETMIETGLVSNPSASSIPVYPSGVFWTVVVVFSTPSTSRNITKRLCLLHMYLSSLTLDLKQLFVMCLFYPQ